MMAAMSPWFDHTAFTAQTDGFPCLEFVGDFLLTHWWQEILWNSTLETRKREEYKSVHAGNRKPAIGFSAAAEPPFRATHSNRKVRCSENDCLSELFCFENSLLTSQYDGLIALKSRNFPNSGSILQLTFPLRLQKLLNQNRIFHSLK